MLYWQLLLSPFSQYSKSSLHSVYPPLPAIERLPGSLSRCVSAPINNQPDLELFLVVKVRQVEGDVLSDFGTKDLALARAAVNVRLRKPHLRRICLSRSNCNIIHYSSFLSGTELVV